MELINYWSPPLLQGEWRKAELQDKTKQKNQWITKCVLVVLTLGRLGQEVAFFKVRMGSMRRFYLKMDQEIPKLNKLWW